MTPGQIKALTDFLASLPLPQTTPTEQK